MKKLPIGIQTFSEIRDGGYLYVDKTQQIYQLLNGSKYYFISRPRRFGKSLTLSTIKEIYAGNQQLFQGLWIHNKWNWQQIRPVVHIQFNEIGYHTNGLSHALNSTLEREAERFGIQLTETSYDQKFRQLLEKIAQKIGKVVLLVDEYDKPIIDYLEKDQLPIAQEHQQILRNFYSIIKSADPNIEFLMITGVSKFSKVSIFSDLNNLFDLTLSPPHATLMGYTQVELEQVFSAWLIKTLEGFPHLDQDQLLAKIKIWYNGYTWNGRDYVYNPFSILNFWANGVFQDYWFKTGTPSFLINALKNAGYFKLNDLRGSSALLESYSLDNLDPRAMLFQTGYLTIKEMDTERGVFTLDYPNREVEQALSNHLIGGLLQRSAVDAVRPVEELESAFLNNQPDRVATIINAMLKDVPSLLFENGNEHFYHALVHLHFRYLGFFIQSEVHTSDGRMDAVAHTPSRIFILEFKIDQNADTALNQIIEKGYAQRFGAENKEIIGVGINFDTKKRCVSDWKALTIIA